MYPGWIFESVDSLDGFAYLGAVLDPVGQRIKFPLNPLGDLFPVFWPEHFLFYLFGPMLGKYIYKITITSLVLVLVFETANELFGKVYGWLSLFLVLSNSYFLLAMGSDYPRGTVIFYFAALLFFVVKGARRPSLGYSLCIGFCAFSMLDSAFLSLMYWPGIVLLYIGLKKEKSSRIFYWADLNIVVGMLLTLLVFCILHYSYTGSMLFFSNTINKANSFLQMDRTSGPLLILEAPWLAPVSVVAIYLGLFIFERFIYFWKVKLLVPSELSKSALLSIVCAFGGVIGLSYLQLFRNQSTISDRYYFNHLIPAVALALTAVVYSHFGKLSDKTIKYIIVGGFIAIGLGGIFWSQIQPNVFIVVTIIGIIFLLSFLKYFNLSVIQKFLGLTVCFLLLLLQAGLENNWNINGQFSEKEWNISNIREETFKSAIQYRSLVSEIDPQGNTIMWYDAGEPLGIFFISFCAMTHYWQDRLINQRFPLVNVPDNGWRGPKHIRASPGQELLIVTNFKAEKLNQLRQNLLAENMSFVIKKEVVFNSALINFDVLKLELIPL